jgi:threonine aldolase
MDIIDLRSDTVSQPTSAMRKAMAQAEVGDDVYQEDPTIKRLEKMAAAAVGKEAGLFLPSGTMGNLAAILAHCGRGDEVILGDKAHTFLFEAGGISALGGVHSNQVPNQPDGTLSLDDIRNAIRPDDIHQPITRLITLENTHNRCGGVALSVEYTHQVGEFARQHDLLVHLDGARLFNAAASQGVPASKLCEPVDSVTFCLSKGLCAPVGSLLCGSQTFINRARRERKILGGGMRQAGILAAAGIVALETMADRLVEDHQRARDLAEGIATIPHLVLDPGTPYTNMVFFSLSDESPFESAAEFAAQTAKLGVKVGVVGARRFRLVTHYWIDDEAVEKSLEVFKQVVDNVMKKQEKARI